MGLSSGGIAKQKTGAKDRRHTQITSKSEMWLVVPKPVSGAFQAELQPQGPPCAGRANLTWALAWLEVGQAFCRTWKPSINHHQPPTSPSPAAINTKRQPPIAGLNLYTRRPDQHTIPSPYQFPPASHSILTFLHHGRGGVQARKGLFKRCRPADPRG